MVGSNDVFVAKISPTGECVWSNSYGDAEDQDLYDIAVDDLGDIFVTGAHTGTLNFGSGGLAAAAGTNVFVAKIASWAPPRGVISMATSRLRWVVRSLCDRMGVFS
ncbi:MAG: hypothetical protein R3F14_04845 [Polyangiaceae bacterium]